MKTVAFFNNKGGVGKTSLVYHLAWMYAELGLPVVAADLDPQANLTSMFLEDDRLEELWASDGPRRTIYGAIQPLFEGAGGLAPAWLEAVGSDLWLVPGDLMLSAAEDELSGEWSGCMDRRPRSFRVLSALWNVLREAAIRAGAKVVLIDVGPNLGAFNRAALVATDYVVVPLAPDLYSLQGLRNLGPTLRRWRREWSERRERNPVEGLDLPEGGMRPVGYVVMQHAVRLDRPVKAYGRWIERIPAAYHEALFEEVVEEGVSIETDPHCLATLKHFRSLMPLAQEARKPMFALRAADGAIGGHGKAVQSCRADFQDLARTVARRCEIELP